MPRKKDVIRDVRDKEALRHLTSSRRVKKAPARTRRQGPSHLKLVHSKPRLRVVIEQQGERYFLLVITHHGERVTALQLVPASYAALAEILPDLPAK